MVIKMFSQNGLTITLIVIGIGLVLFIVYLLELKLSKVLTQTPSRYSKLYQGGELLQPKARRYGISAFNRSIYFLILHVLGFFCATFYVLGYYGYKPLNWTTASFFIIIFYTTLLVRRVEARSMTIEKGGASK